MSYSVVREADLTGLFRKLGSALGVEAFGINQWEIPPGAESLQHTELGSQQQEVYIVLRGDGHMTIDESDVALAPGTFVFVSPDSSRQAFASDKGLSLVVIGA
jgi:uncharacterized cupin superfamily protein